jgi:hypothetical protein
MKSCFSFLILRQFHTTMKHLLKVALPLFVSSCALAQPGKPKTPLLSPLSAYKTQSINLDALPKTDSGSREYLFDHFIVLDQRPDTARIGMHIARFKTYSAKTRQLIFPHPAAQEIARYLNTRFAHPGAPYTALVVIRTLWLSDPNYIREDLVRDPNRRFEKTHIRLKAEVYARKDSTYTPLLRFDSLQVSFEFSNTPFGHDLSGMLDRLADTASLLTTQKEGKGRQVSLEDIRGFNAARFDALISHDIPLAKGVYDNFEEFRNNTPSIMDYEIRKDPDNMMVLYVKGPDGKSVYTHEAWGYCDGKNIFVMKDGVLHPTWKEGNAFYLFDRVKMIQYQNSTNNPIAPDNPVYIGGGVAPGMTGFAETSALGTLFNIATDGTTRRILTVDMDSGILY